MWVSAWASETACGWVSGWGWAPRQGVCDDEDVGGAVGVFGDQVRRLRVEGDEAAVGADAGAKGFTVALAPPGNDETDPGGAAVLLVVDKDVLDAVGVVVDQVEGAGGEGDEAAVGADVRLRGVEAARGAVGGDADPGGGAGLPVVQEDVRVGGGVVGDQVGGVRLEGDEASTGADAGELGWVVGPGAVGGHAYAEDGLGGADIDEDVPADASGDQVGGVGAEGDEFAVTVDGWRLGGAVGLDHGVALPELGDAPGAPHLQIAQEDVRDVVGVLVGRKEVGRLGTEGDEATVGADAGLGGVAEALEARAADAGPGQGLLLPVIDVDLGGAVGEAGDQVGGGGLEGDEAAVGADGRRQGGGVGRSPFRGAAHHDGGAGLEIVEEDVCGKVGVVWDQVGGVGLVGDEAAIAADAGGPGGSVAPGAVGGDADDLDALGSS